MVLAAGLGSRLRPLTDLLPKPLVPVGDRPALAHVLDRLAAAGLGPVAVNAHHGLDAMRAFLEARGGAALSPEPDLLGTAGGLARAAALLGDGDALVWNADILVELDPRRLIAAHAGAAARGAEATLVVQPLAPGQGSVGLDASGRVVRLRDARAGDESSGGEFLGVQVIGEGLRRALPARGCLVGDVYIPAMLRGARLAAHLWEGPFFDIGTPRTYLAANLAWAAARGLSAWLHPTARVAPGVVVRDAVIGAGATVNASGGGDCALERCVVWPGASVVAPLAAAIAVPGHVLRVSPC